MRFIVALLAVIGLLASPAGAAAAQASCHDHGGAKMMSMPMADMPSMAQADGQKADPCCDPGKSQGQTKHDATSCLQACAVMCGVVAALPSTPTVLLAPSDPAAREPARLASLKPHEPSRLERPPKSIA
jgi:hypothetical protein